MKKLILTTCLTLLSLAANAEALGYIVNKAGGQIIFTSEFCDDNGTVYKELRRAFAFGKDGTTLEACYYLDVKTNLLMLAWKDTRERSIFKLEDVTLY